MGSESRPQNGRLLRIRPRYFRLYTDRGVELAEANFRYRELDWQIPLGQAALISLDVWNYHFARDTLERIEEITVGRIAPLVEACRTAGLQIIIGNPDHQFPKPGQLCIDLITELKRLPALTEVLFELGVLLDSRLRVLFEFRDGRYFLCRNQVFRSSPRRIRSFELRLEQPKDSQMCQSGDSARRLFGLQQGLQGLRFVPEILRPLAEQ